MGEEAAQFPIGRIGPSAPAMPAMPRVVFVVVAFAVSEAFASVVAPVMGMSVVVGVFKVHWHSRLVSI
jgi:hypothetical protein